MKWNELTKLASSQWNRGIHLNRFKKYNLIYFCSGTYPMQKRTVKKIVFSKRFVDDSVLYSETYDQCETKKKGVLCWYSNNIPRAKTGLTQGLRQEMYKTSLEFPCHTRQ